MNQIKTKLILLKDDYDILLKYMYSRMSPMSKDFKNAEQLYEELQEAEIIVEEDSMPADVIRINSFIEVEEQATGRQMKLKLVTPDQANLKEQRLSIFAPLGIALIGYRKGQQVVWEMPSGQKVFTIRNVSNGKLQHGISN